MLATWPYRFRVMDRVRKFIQKLIIIQKKKGELDEKEEMNSRMI